MIVFEMDCEIEDLMLEGKVKVENIEKKKSGHMFTFIVDDDNEQKKLRVLFIGMKVSDIEYDFENSYLTNLLVYEARQAYGSHYFIGQSARIVRNIEQPRLDRVLISGRRLS